MLKKILLFILCSSHVHIFSAAKSTASNPLMQRIHQDTVDARSKSSSPCTAKLTCEATAIFMQEEDHFERTIQFEEERARRFTAKVGSNRNGTWIFTEETNDEGRPCVREESYIKTDERRETKEQLRFADGKVKITRSFSSPIAPSESKHYCYDDTLTQEENYVLQLYVDIKCIECSLRKTVQVHRFRHLSQEQKEKELNYIRFKISIFLNQIRTSKKAFILKKADSLVRDEKLHSIFSGGYFLGKPLERSQRPRALTI